MHRTLKFEKEFGASHKNKESFRLVMHKKRKSHPIKEESVELNSLKGVLRRCKMTCYHSVINFIICNL
jgi:hypothetical protein